MSERNAKIVQMLRETADYIGRLPDEYEVRVTWERPPQYNEEASWQSGAKVYEPGSVATLTVEVIDPPKPKAAAPASPAR